MQGLRTSVLPEFTAAPSLRIGLHRARLSPLQSGAAPWGVLRPRIRLWRVPAPRASGHSDRKSNEGWTVGLGAPKRPLPIPGQTQEVAAVATGSQALPGDGRAAHPLLPRPHLNRRGLQRSWLQDLVEFRTRFLQNSL